MLEDIKEAIVGILNFFDTIYEVIVNLVENTIEAIKIIGSAVAQIPDYIEMMPDWIQSIMTAGLTVIVIYLLIFHHTGKGDSSE